MATMAEVTSKNVDLTNCDHEQIQFPGAILPHGVLLVLREPGLDIIQASQNTADFFAIAAADLLQQPLSRLLTPTDVDSLRESLLRDRLEGPPTRVAVAAIQGRSFNLLLHRNDQVVFLELEPRQQEAFSAWELYGSLHASILTMQAATSVQQFLDLAIDQVRTFTGFDRVMGYKFLDDGSGWVRSESVIAGETPYLGQHFPPSDVPAPAKRLFSLGWLRHQPDIGYTPVPMLPELNPVTGGPLDMSYAILRSVSVMYSQYLKNMGTSASMVITLMKDGKLWGLIACHHHHGPKHVPYEVRLACEFMANMISLLISQKEDHEHASYRSRIRSSQQRLVQAATPQVKFSQALAERMPDLLQFVEAGGVALATEESWLTAGATPSISHLNGLLDWLADNVSEAFATDCLSSHYEAAQKCKETASGLLALRLSATARDYLLWFRPEVIQTVKWAGNPSKPVDLSDDGQRLFPRTSFALWIETMRLKSLPWLDFEVQAARDLRVSLLERSLRKADQTTRLYEKLEKSYQELDAFTYVASHDLKEPLRGIHNYARFLLEDCAGKLEEEDSVKLKNIARLSQRMENLLNSLLQYSRMSREDLSLQSCDVGAVVGEVIDSMAERLRESGAKLRMASGFPAITADPVTVSEIFANLISNALKYNDKSDKWVEVGWGNGEKQPFFFVRDNGIGIEAGQLDSIFTIFRRLHGPREYGGGAGAGLTIARKLAERHGGRMWVDSTVGEGSCFCFTLSSAENAGAGR
jgi:light-regulated signal transduction histidine kinase (bacteriophytochrome)